MSKIGCKSGASSQRRAAPPRLPPVVQRVRLLGFAARSGTEQGAAWLFLPAGPSRSCAAVRRLCIEKGIITDQPQFAIAPMAVSARRMRPNVRGPLWVNNGPWVASELGPLIPQQRTCSDYCGISVWCPIAEAIQTIQPEPIMPRRQPGRRLGH